MRTVRLFLAINLPAPERRAIRAATAPMRDAAPRLGWVTEERLHLTLKFFGEQPETSVATLRDALGAVARRHRPVALHLGGLGAFPNLRAPRVVWLGVAHDPKLELLQHDLEHECGTLGYELDGRAFRPHVTLARVRDRLAPSVARALATAARGVRYTGVVDVRSVDLMASELLPTGPRYTVVAALPLGEG